MKLTEIKWYLKAGQPLYIFVGRIGHRILEIKGLKVRTNADPKVYPEASGWISIKGCAITTR